MSATTAEVKAYGFSPKRGAPYQSALTVFAVSAADAKAYVAATTGGSLWKKSLVYRGEGDVKGIAAVTDAARAAQSARLQGDTEIELPPSRTLL